MEGIHVFLTWLNTCMIKCTQHHWFCYVPGFTATYTLRQALLQWSIHSCTLFLILLKLITLRICTIECEEKDEILYPCTKYTNTKKPLISRKVSPKYDFLGFEKYQILSSLHMISVIKCLFLIFSSKIFFVNLYLCICELIHSCVFFELYFLVQ